MLAEDKFIESIIVVGSKGLFFDSAQEVLLDVVVVDIRSFAFEILENLFGGSEQLLFRLKLVFAQEGFELVEEEFSWIELRGVGRQDYHFEVAVPGKFNDVRFCAKESAIYYEKLPSAPDYAKYGIEKLLEYVKEYSFIDTSNNQLASNDSLFANKRKKFDIWACSVLVCGRLILLAPSLFPSHIQIDISRIEVKYFMVLICQNILNLLAIQRPVHDVLLGISGYGYLLYPLENVIVLMQYAVDEFGIDVSDIQAVAAPAQAILVFYQFVLYFICGAVGIAFEDAQYSLGSVGRDGYLLFFHLFVFAQYEQSGIASPFAVEAIQGGIGDVELSGELPQ